MVTKRSDFDLSLTLPTAIEEAKKLKYNGKDLEVSEKTIFDNALLKDKDASGNEIIKLNDVKDTAALLDNLKKAQAELENEEKRTDLNLSTDGNDLLIEFLKEHRNKTIAYQVIEEKKPGEIEKIIDNYQTLQYRRVNQGLEAQKKAAMKALSSIFSNIKKQDKLVEKARKAYEAVSEDGKRKGYKNLLEEAVEFKKQGEEIVKALKDDIDKKKTGHVGYNILKAAIDTQKKVADVLYRKESSAFVPATESWGSIIETSVANPYSDKKFTHPNYLGEALPWQMRQLFEQFDKDKLFTLINDKFSGNLAEAKKVQESYKRVLGALVEETPSDEESLKGVSIEDRLIVLYPTDVPNYELVEGSEVLIPKTKKEAREWSLYLTDVLYFMNALFPKGTADFANDIEFLKPGNKALPFKDSKHTLDSKHSVYWRGREDNTLGIAGGYRDKFPGTRFPRAKAFGHTNLELSWGGAKGQSIPEFFWQVYDKAEAVQFNGSRRVLDKEGKVVEFFKDELSVYEQKLLSYQVGSKIDPYLMAYSERVKDIISGKIKIGAYAVEEFDENNPNSDKGIDGEKYWTLFEKACHKILTHTHRSFHEFRKAADIDYRLLLASPNKELVVPYMIEGTHSDIVDDIIKIWDEMNEVFDSRIDNAKKLRDKWVDELDKQTRNNARKVDEERKLAKIEKAYKTIEDGKFDQLKAQLDNLGGKLDPTRPSSITYQEAMAMHVLHWVIKEHEGTGIDAKYDAYMTRLELWEKFRAGDLEKYGSWKALGSSFAKRLSAWKKNEGRNLDERAIKAFFDIIKFDLKKAEKSRGLSPEEKADLVAITNYIDTDKQPKLRASQLEIIFAIDTEISQELTDKWNNYGDEKKFKNDSKHLKDIADIINNLSDDDKGIFFTELKTYLTGKSGVPAFPSDTAVEQDKLNYYYTLDPEHMIGAFAAWRIKTDTDEKKKIEDEMKDAKDANNIPLSKDKETGYGDGTKFTDEGIIKYCSEKIGGVKHSYRKQDEKKDGPGGSNGKGFWSWDNPSAIVTGGFLIVGTGLVLAGIIWWEKLAAWWDGPADAEGNGDDDEEDGE